MKRHYITLTAFIFIGSLLRIMLLNAPFTEDERKGILIARSISFNPDHLNLPAEDPYETHPLLSVYATKIGTLFLGESNLGVRFFHLLFGILTLVVLYVLVLEIGKQEALWAVFLLAFNQFHMHVSVKSENNSLLLFLTTLIIWIYHKAVKTNDRKLFLWLGPLGGLAFLTKGVSLLLAAALILFLFTDNKKREWFRTKEFYLTFLFFIVTISPWILWVTIYGSSQLIFNPEMYLKPAWIPNRTALNFFLIAPLSWLEGVDYRLRISWEDAIIDGLTGIILLVGTVYSVKFIKNDFYKLLYFIFAVVFSVLSFFSLPGLKWGEFWWAAIVLIPAVCFTAKMLSEGFRRSRVCKSVVLVYGFYLVINAAIFILTIDRLGYPPRRFSAFVDDDYIAARMYEDKKMFDPAIAEVKRLLRNSPNDIETLSYLGWLFIQKNDFNSSLDAWFKAMEIEPDFIHPYNLFYSQNQELNYRYSLALIQEDAPYIHYYLGVINYYNNLDKTAFEELQKVDKSSGYHLRAQYYLGMINLRTKNYTEAIRHFNQVITLDPKHYRAYFQIGQCYSSMGQNELAVEFFQKTLDINPDDARSYYRLGSIYQELGYQGKARKMFYQAKSIYHDDLKSRFELGKPFE
ncbi:MAG: glycosyltransferase family 39 protein [Candidatus Omnitrophota bacterium]